MTCDGICDKRVPPMTVRDAARQDYQYSLLYETLMGAYYQAAEGKGRERHATGEAFQDQLIMLIERFDIGFQRGQAVKKIVESKRLEATSKEAAVRELRGAIVYCSAKIISLEGGGE